MKSKMTSTERNVSVALCLAFLAIIVFRNIFTAKAMNLEAYYNYGVSDYMLNYQGGFMRRGLLGEILYQLFLRHPYPLHYAVLWMDLVALSGFLLLSLYVFYKRRWMPIMPLALITDGALHYRRDFLALMLAFTIFSLLLSHIRHLRQQEQSMTRLVAALLLCSLSILIYEPSFFFTVPICMLLYGQHMRRTKTLWGDILKVGGVFSLPLFSMLAVCLAKGDGTTATAIWESWQPLFDYLDFQPTMIGRGVDFLNISAEKVMAIHLGTNYGIGIGGNWGLDPLLVTGSLLMFVGCYFLTIRTPALDGWDIETNTLLSDLYLFQFICLLPMFSVLSCDFGRTILYVIYTSYFLVYLLEQNGVACHVPYLHKASAQTIFLSRRSPILSSLWLYVLVLFLLPFAQWGGISILHPLILEYLQQFLLYIDLRG